jgi:DNA-binding LacI/PurR family transcriptional regulator
MNMAKIAKLAGTSVATVSRAFKSPEVVSPRVRKRIMKIAEDQNYVYHAAAADLARQHSNFIGVLVPTANKSVFGETLMAIQEKAQECQLFPIIGNTLYDKELESGILRSFQERRTAGIIFTGFTFGQERLIQKLIEQGIACVVIWEKLENTAISYVGFDNFKAAYSATEYLINIGHKRIGLIVGPYEKVGRVNKRYLGYRQALCDHRLPIDNALILSAEPDLFEGREAMRQLLSLPQRPSAVFAASDRLAIGSLAATKEFGLRVPRDISIMGFDDVEFAAFTDPPLTTVRVPARKIGHLAVTVLQELIENRTDKIRRYCLDTDLVIRDSCAEYAG